MSIKVRVIFAACTVTSTKWRRPWWKVPNNCRGLRCPCTIVAELIPDDVLEKRGAKAAKAAFSKVPVATVHQLADAHTIIFGTATRFGWPRRCAISSIRRDPCGPKGSLIGKIGSVFASTATQHGGQETTLTSFHTTLLHHGMVIVGVPYRESGLAHLGDITGGTPYGATTPAGPDGSRQPSENELKIARYQGKYDAELAAKLLR